MINPDLVQKLEEIKQNYLSKSSSELKRKVKRPPCGNQECNVSEGICGKTTFGSGELDEHGYWEKPCGICAREYERRCPDWGECWPLPR